MNGWMLLRVTLWQVLLAAPVVLTLGLTVLRDTSGCVNSAIGLAVGLAAGTAGWAIELIRLRRKAAR